MTKGRFFRLDQRQIQPSATKETIMIGTPANDANACASEEQPLPPRRMT